MSVHCRVFTIYCLKLSDRGKKEDHSLMWQHCVNDKGSMYHERPERQWAFYYKVKAHKNKLEFTASTWQHEPTLLEGSTSASRAALLWKLGNACEFLTFCEMAQTRASHSSQQGCCKLHLSVKHSAFVRKLRKLMFPVHILKMWGIKMFHSPTLFFPAKKFLENNF